MGKPYHVVPNKDGKLTWDVKREGSNRALSTGHRKKKAAVKRAKKAAVNQRVGVIVHRQNGTVGYGHDYEGLKRSYPQWV